MGRSHREWADLYAKFLAKNFGEKLVSVVVYGSVATGRQTSRSDIDILIVVKDLPTGRFKRRFLLDPIYTWLDSEVHGEPMPFFSTLIKTPDEAKRLSPIYFDMVDRHLLLIDKDDFFKTVLEDVASRLKKLGACRKKVGKIEYWDLKPDYKPGEIFEI